MPVKLKCPACTDAVFAEDADRGTTIKCGTCWADVPVPKAEGSGVVPPPAAKPLPAKPLPPTAAPVAKALPVPGQALPAAAPVAKPVPAQPVQPATLNPVGGNRYGSRRDDDKPERDKPKYKTRDYDDDDDDRPTRTTSGGGGGKGVLIAFICLGLVLAIGVAGAAYLLLRGTGDETTDTGPAPGDNGGRVAGGGNNNFQNPFDPPKPKVGGDPGRGDFNPFGGGIDGGGGKPPANKGGWVNFRGKGFELLAPARMTKGDHKFQHDTQNFTGDKYEAREGDGLEVHAWEIGAQQVVKHFTPEFVAACTFNDAGNVKRVEGVREMPHGHPGIVFTTKEINHENGVVLMTAKDTKVYVFRIRWKNAVADGERKKEDFLASIRIVEGRFDDDQLAVKPKPPRVPDFGDPVKPKPVEKPWEVVEAKSGFSVLAPAAFRGAKPEPFLVEPQQGVRVSGRKFSAEDDQFLYLVAYFDLPKDYDPDLRKLLVHPVVPHFNSVSDTEAVKVDGKDGVKLDLRQAHGLMQRGLGVKLGYRQFCFAVFAKDVFHKDDPTLQERTDKFLNSVKLAFDPKTADPYADEPRWVPLAKAVGFGVLVPKNATAVTDKQAGFGFGADVSNGKEYSTDVDGITYQVTVHLTTPKLSAQKIADGLRGGETILNNEQVKVNGLAFEHYELKHFFGHPILFRAAAVGNTVFTLKVLRSEAFGKQVGDKEFADKAAKFLNSFRTGTGSVTEDAGKAGGGEMARVGELAQVAAGKVRPFWAGTFLPTANEFVTVGTRDPNANPPGGVIRRYSVPDFKLKATYHLNMPAHRVAADEKGGKLYLAMVSTPVDAQKPEREAAIVAGDIHVYDLKKVLDGSVGELEQLKPLSVLTVGGSFTQVSGLEVSPSGDALFVSAVVTTGTKVKQAYRGKLTRFDTASGKSADLPSCDFPVWAIKLSADGRRLAILERPIDPTGVVKGGSLALVDAVNWRRVKSVPLSGTPLDVAYLGGRPAALENAGGTVRLVVAEPDGENNEVPVDGDPLYVRATPDGKRVLLAAGLPANGLGVYTLDAAKPPKLDKKAAAGELGGTALGGLAAISPDGKLAVLNCGVVIDLEKTK